MFLFKSKPVEEKEGENVVEQKEAEQKAADKASNKGLFDKFSFFQPPSLTPEEVAILVNLISGVTRRGALTIEEIRVISPLYQKLCRVITNNESWFVTEEFELEDDNPSGAQTSPEVSEDEDSCSVKSTGPRSGRGGKKKKKNNRKRR